MAVCLFEDFSIASLFPLTHLQADFDLRSGVFTSRERVQRFFPEDELCLYVRPGLAEVMRERSGLRVNDTAADAWLYLNGRTMLDAPLVGLLSDARGTDVVFVKDDSVIAVVAESTEFRRFLASWLNNASQSQSHNRAAIPVTDKPAVHVHTAKMYSYPWDLISMNSAALVEDARWFPAGVDTDADVHSSVIMVCPENLSIASGARIRAACVLDASEGPIIIGENVDIFPLAVIMGPVSIGAGSRIKAGAKIYEGCSIGPVCRIGGEVEASIFHSFANKQHEGFTGHSYFASWTNLGADTNTSDLKNNYSEIRVTLEGKEYQTDTRLLGTIMAEHSKCGINTMFNTGTVVGVGCNIFGADFPPKAIPGFVWGGADGFSEYEPERCLATVRTVMQRRNQRLSDAEERLLHKVFLDTKLQRNNLIFEKTNLNSNE